MILIRSFDWFYRKISAKEYYEKLNAPDNDGANSFEITANCEKNGKYKIVIDAKTIKKLAGPSKNEFAYKMAADTRKFEIDKYWQRTLYFWGFITAIYVAYFNVLKELYTENFCQKHGAVPLVVLSALGTFFCVSWLLASKGSKHWHENWEKHIDMLEDDITGPLFKIYSHGVSYSVSRINIMVGWVLSVSSFFLFGFEIICFIKNELCLTGFFAGALAILLIAVSLVSLLVYGEIVRGNKKQCGNIEFDIKEYNILKDEK